MSFSLLEGSQCLRVSVRVLPCWELRASRRSLRSAVKQSMQFDVEDPLRTLNLTCDQINSVVMDSCKKQTHSFQVTIEEN